MALTLVLRPTDVTYGDLDHWTVRIRENSIVLRHDITFISAAVLKDHLSLTLKELVPDRQIGICQEDRCIPYMLGDGPNMAWQGNEEYYIPIGHLLDALGGTAWREGETHIEFGGAQSCDENNGQPSEAN